MEKSKIDLLPCPFCGRKPKSIVNIQMYAIGCSFSKCHVYPCVVKKTPEEAAKAWNTRASGWIPCRERMPEKSTSVLISAQGHRVTAFYDSVKGVFMLTETEGLFYSMSAVTHWMPLPDPPETEDKT